MEPEKKKRSLNDKLQVSCLPCEVLGFRSKIKIYVSLSRPQAWGTNKYSEACVLFLLYNIPVGGVEGGLWARWEPCWSIQGVQARAAEDPNQGRGGETGEELVGSRNIKLNPQDLMIG